MAVVDMSISDRCRVRVVVSVCGGRFCKNKIHKFFFCVEKLWCAVSDLENEMYD